MEFIAMVLIFGALAAYQWGCFPAILMIIGVSLLNFFVF